MDKAGTRLGPAQGPLDWADFGSDFGLDPKQFRMDLDLNIEPVHLSS